MMIRESKIVNWFGMAGITLWPFILIKKSIYRDRYIFNPILIYHEKIHLKQQAEMLVIPFYFAYLVNYLINLIRYRQHRKAYKQIIFEREAKANEENMGYLGGRKPYAFLNYWNS